MGALEAMEHGSHGSTGSCEAQAHVARLEFPRETGLILRCAGKAGNPFQTTQGNRWRRLVLLEEVGLHGGGAGAGEVALTWETNHEDTTCLLPRFPSLASVLWPNSPQKASI